MSGTFHSQKLLAQFQRKTVITDEAEIVYHLIGEGPVICLLASTGRGGLDFIELAIELANAGMKVMLPNPRGLEGSLGSLDNINFHDFAADVMSCILTESDSAIIAGHAYGCWIARTVAADYPKLINGLVLMAAGSGKFAPELTDAINLVSAGRGTIEERLAALRLAFFAPSSNPEPWLEGWNPTLISAQRAAREATAPISWQHSGSAPVLDLIAQQDPFRPPTTYQDYFNIFGRRVTQKIINNASHALPDEQPKQVSQSIIDWLKQL